MVLWNKDPEVCSHLVQKLCFRFLKIHEFCWKTFKIIMDYVYFPGQLQEVQRRLPHRLDADIIMANCAWEYMVLWNKDPEVCSHIREITLK